MTMLFLHACVYKMAIGCAFFSIIRCLHWWCCASEYSAFLFYLFVSITTFFWSWYLYIGHKPQFLESIYFFIFSILGHKPQYLESIYFFFFLNSIFTSPSVAETEPLRFLYIERWIGTFSLPPSNSFHFWIWLTVY